MLSWHCSKVYKKCVMFRYKIITTPTRWDPLQGQTSHTAFFVRLPVKYLISICRFTECIDFLMLKLIKDQVPLFAFSASHFKGTLLCCHSIAVGFTNNVLCLCTRLFLLPLDGIYCRVKPLLLPPHTAFFVRLSNSFLLPVYTSGLGEALLEKSFLSK